MEVVVSEVVREDFEELAQCGSVETQSNRGEKIIQRSYQVVSTHVN